jgi:DNA-binding transcriptional MerR regulator
MMPYDTYRLYQTERPKNPAEIRHADEQAARITSAVSSLLRGLVRSALTWSALRVSCSATMSGIFSPSEAAEQSGFSLETLRYYERIGLLGGIDRGPSGHRRFHDEDLEWLGVLRCLRDTGMPIARMREYAELARGGDATMVQRMNLLVEHELNVQGKVALLQAQQRHLREKIEWYRRRVPAAAS